MIRRPCSLPRCSAFAEPGARTCAAHVAVVTARAVEQAARRDEVRGTAAQRGYTSRWSAYARQFRAHYPISEGYLVRTPFWTPALAQAHHALRAMAAARREFVGFYFPDQEGAQWLTAHPIYEFHRTARPEPSEAVDHIIPVEGPDDPLFWAEWNHQALSHAQHSEKTARFDGGYRGRAHLHHART